MRASSAALLCCMLALTSIPAGAQTNGGPRAASPSQPAVYQQWLDEDVRWIVTPEERAQFVSLASNEDRDAFIGTFWASRDPTPDTEENELKEEHYRRIEYSNIHFAARTTGSLTDRGRVYIVYGPPDAITAGSGGMPKEIWHYEAFNTGITSWEGRLLRKLNRVDLIFFDDCKCNDYRLHTAEPKW